jgi:hypothetical protein
MQEAPGGLSYMMQNIAERLKKEKIILIPMATLYLLAGRFSSLPWIIFENSASSSFGRQ